MLLAIAKHSLLDILSAETIPAAYKLFTVEDSDDNYVTLERKFDTAENSYSWEMILETKSGVVTVSELVITDGDINDSNSDFANAEQAVLWIQQRIALIVEN